MPVTGAIAVLANTWLGWHDEWSPEGMTYFYDHRDSDGESQSPFFNSLIASGVFGAGIWLAIKRQLRKYMTFEIAGVSHPHPVD